MKKILFTTAYSMSSQNTWQYTLKLAHYFQAQISLMHVYEDASSSLSKDSEFFDNRLIDSLDSFDEERYQEEQNRLTSFANKHTPHINQSVQLKLRLETEYEAESLAFKVLEGKLLENVETYLDFVDADMMALTNHKQGFFTQLIDPDLQNQLAAKTIVPLLTFKQTATSS